MFKFIHAADIHLDSPLLNLEQYDGAPVEAVRMATRQALENLVGLALREAVAFVLIAGDLYDGNWDNTRTGLHFKQQMARLRSAEIPVFLIAGNHDAANKMTYNLRLTDNVRYLTENKPETIELDQVGVAIHGQGFARPAVTENLAVHYPAAKAGYYNIGLLHTCATCTGHEPYAPCSLDDLRGRGYDYWALGHVHQRGILCRDPLVVFPGNVQGRHIRETGAKGCYLITVDDRGAASEQFQPLDVMRWENCRVDVTAACDGDEVVDAFVAAMNHLRSQHAGSPLALRVELFGASRAHANLSADPQKWHDEIRGEAIVHGDGAVWIEKVKFETRPAHEVDPLSGDGPLGELQAVLAELLADEAQLIAMGSELAELDRKLPAELKTATDALGLTEAGTLRELIGTLGPLLAARLSPG